MRMLTFAGRNTKEILRDPINLAFGLGFPLVLILLLSAIQANVSVPLFEIQHLTPGVAVFGLAFLTLFSATLIAKDRGSSLMQRLYTTPLKPRDFIAGYLLPMLPIALGQSAASYLTAFLLGLPISANVLIAMILLLPMAVFYISLGLLCGSLLNVRQVGGICGALLTNLSAWLSGVWFDLDLVGGAFRTIANMLPFVHGVELERAAVAGAWEGILPHLLPVTAYALAALAGAVWLFLRQMKRQ